jgi:hypothetical protein
VCDIPITEKLLNAGGWRAMKPARELLKSGRLSGGNSASHSFVAMRTGENPTARNEAMKPFGFDK